MRGTKWLLAAVVVALVLLGVSPAIRQSLLALLSMAPRGIVENIASAILVSVVALNYRAILRFLQRRLKPTDGQIVGTWFVSRFIKKNTQLSVLTEEWIIVRSLGGRYVVRMHFDAKVYMTFSGLVQYNERDRLNILINGVDHHQQSLVCFQTNIPRADDSRMLGLGVGDDSNYFLTTRVYLASRVRYGDDYVSDILNEASAAVLTGTGAGPMLQLTPDVIAATLGKHPLPATGASTPIPRSRSWWFGLRG